MNTFSPSRFWRVLQNDALRVARPLGYGAIALLGLTTIIYVANFDPEHVPREPTHIALFAIYLLGAGVLFTSMSFNDMHHPLERYHYLMLPVSNTERFLSRYLLTGPLFVLFAAIAFQVMDWTGNLVSDWWQGATQPWFNPLSSASLIIARIYLAVHLIAFTGAICFRSYALIKTALAVLVIQLGAAATAYLSMRILYMDQFDGFALDTERALRMPLAPIFASTWVNHFVAYAVAAWILYVAYRCLKAHEVQDEL